MTEHEKSGGLKWIEANSRFASLGRVIAPEFRLSGAPEEYELFPLSFSSSVAGPILLTVRVLAGENPELSVPAKKRFGDVRLVFRAGPSRAELLYLGTLVFPIKAGECSLAFAGDFVIERIGYEFIKADTPQTR